MREGPVSKMKTKSHPFTSSNFSLGSTSVEKAGKNIPCNSSRFSFGFCAIRKKNLSSAGKDCPAEEEGRGSAINPSPVVIGVVVFYLISGVWTSTDAPLRSGKAWSFYAAVTAY